MFVTCNVKMYFFIQIWEHTYATAGYGRILDRFVTCNVKMYVPSTPIFPYKYGGMAASLYSFICVAL